MRLSNIYPVRSHVHLLSNQHWKVDRQDRPGRPNNDARHLGTEEAPANELIGAILTNRSIQVKDVVGCDASGNLIRKTNAEKTAAANQKADEIRQAFLDWVWE